MSFRPHRPAKACASRRRAGRGLPLEGEGGEARAGAPCPPACSGTISAGAGPRPDLVVRGRRPASAQVVSNGAMAAAAAAMSPPSCAVHVPASSAPGHAKSCARPPLADAAIVGSRRLRARRRARPTSEASTRSPHRSRRPPARAGWPRGSRAAGAASARTPGRRGARPIASAVMRRATLTLETTILRERIPPTSRSRSADPSIRPTASRSSRRRSRNAQRKRQVARARSAP